MSTGVAVGATEALPEHSIQSTASTSSSLRRYPCGFDGCDKTFQRKEHLGRHERTHNPQTVCVCKVCNRKFNRSDSLLRHLARHGDAFRPNPSGRSKRACISCHSGKIKCDGTQPCSTCKKKEIDCIYRQDTVEQSESSQKSLSPGLSDQIPAIQEIPTVAPASSPHSSLTPPRDPLAAVTSALSLHGRELETNIISMPPPRFGYIDWMSVRIQPDGDHSMSLGYGEVDAVDRKYLDSFFENFHHRWALIHRPSFEEVNNDTPLIAAMKMIGAWLCGTKDAQAHAITVHERLIDNLLPRLSRFDTSNGLCLGMCETALMNIIFALYYGNDKAISRAFMVRNLLVAVLREVEFFKSETAWADEKPGYFLPLRLVKMGQRQRLAANLFKIDTYFSLLRYQPKILMPEDLYFTIPGTYAVWNANGLHIWEERQAVEPQYRADKSMLDLINASAGDQPIDHPIIIEDVQLCMCSIQSSMWKLFQPAGTTKDCEIDVVLQKDSLRRRLSALQTRLDQMAIPPSSVEFGQEPHLPLRQYYGYEDHFIAGWEEIVKARVQSLHFDASMLSHLLDLHLHADVAMLSHMAKCQTLTSIQAQSERHKQAHVQRHIAVRSWATTSMARQALAVAFDILLLHQSIRKDDGQRQASSLQKHALDPIAHVAVSVAALVVWAYATYGLHSCVSCVLDLVEPQYDHVSAIELANWTNHKTDYAQQEARRKWIEGGGGARLNVNGMPVCSCNVGFLVKPFQACLPAGWEAAERIAVGVFVR